MQELSSHPLDPGAGENCVLVQAIQEDFHALYNSKGPRRIS